MPNVFAALDLGSNESPPPNTLDGTDPVNTGSGHDDHPLNPASTVFVPAAVNSQTAAHPVVNRCRLPKLNLPTFSGNPLDWQTFWDCYEASVHNNTTLNGAQKFSYLKAQVTGDAARVIAGFPLTNVIYAQSVNLLKERFGQPSKIVNAHMQALLNLNNPSLQLQSLQVFYDTLETHIRGLNSLGKSEDSYGALLVPIVQSKLPSELKKALAREHNDTDWTISELRAAILKEIKILEAGVHVNLSNNLFDKAFPPSSTMQLHTSSPKSPQSFANQIVKK